MMKEQNKARWRPQIRTDIEWDDLIKIPEKEEMRKLEIKARRDISSKHPILSQTPSLASSMEELSKAEAKKMRRLQRQEDLENKSLRQKSKAFKHSEEDNQADQEDTGSEDSDSEDNKAEAGSEEDHYEQPPYLSIGLIGQPKYV